MITLKNEGLEYRRITHHFNSRGIRTTTGKERKGTHVYSFIKLYEVRNHRLENVKTHDYGIEIGTFELKWMRG